MNATRNKTTAAARFVGLDVHKHEITYCIIDTAGDIIERKRFLLNRDTLNDFAKNKLSTSDQVALESTTNCWAVAEIVQEHVDRVVVSNPMATKAIAQSKIKQIDVDGLDMISSDLRLLDALAIEVDRFDLRLAQLGYDDPRVKLLMTMPGVSVVVAQALVAAFGDITRFKTADKAASYLGLAPSTKQSAKTCHHGPITKRGNSNARWMLVQAAQHMLRQPGPLGHFFRRLKSRKNHNIAVVATARKMAMIAWRMLTTNEPYRYSPPSSTATKLAKLRIMATGKKRRGGSPKGVKSVAKLPGGGRTIKSLDAIYAQEDLPSRTSPQPGETKHLAQTNTAEFVQSIAQKQVIPRRTATPPPNKQASSNTTITAPNENP